MGPMTGRAVFEGQGFLKMVAPGVGTEILYSFIIIICSLMIYFGTKELYELSSYKGLKYFREAFLFFALAYFFRSFMKLLSNYFSIRMILDMPGRTFGGAFGQLTLFVFMYLSSIAIFYLLYSVMYKKWGNNSNKIYLFHLLAFIFALISSISRGQLFYFLLNIVLFLFVIFIVMIAYKNSKRKTKGHNLYIIYVLLSFFWILNVLDILIPDFFQMYQLLIYTASILIFLIMLYKVLKKSGTS